VTSAFIVGQRWVSNTESELGLGVVEENDGRRVMLFFPAAEKRRIYATDNAPLSRVEYSVGEQISTRDGVLIRISERLEHAGCFIYQGTDEDGRDLSITELDLNSAVQFSKPDDRLLAGQIDANSAFELRADTIRHRQRHRASPAFGLLGPRVSLLAHQLYIASQVGKRHAPRVLLADEVGLGKTIEAGLILHQQLLSGRINRVLVLVPDALVHQWLVEMLRRFNLQFSVFDEQRCAQLDEAGEDNPFETAQLVLCGWSLLTAAEQRAHQCIDADWDVLVVDEAHHLTWTKSERSPVYNIVESLSARTQGLLLLTATPEQLGIDGHFARLRLVDPDRYHDLDKFRAEESSYTVLAEVVDHLMAESPADASEMVSRVTASLGAVVGEEVSTALTEAQSPAERDEVIDRLLDRHGTGRVLFRNTRDAIGGFAQRELVAHRLTNDSEFQPELLDSARVDWLMGWLREHRDEKALLITSQGAHAQTLERELRVRGGFRTAVFHEEMTLIARDRAAAYFADDEDGAQALVCSEIGSEGRNFQFAHHLILLDLPRDPDLLEQRIGRLDRIGQRHTVQIHVPHLAGTREEILLRWYHEGADAFTRPCPGGDRLMVVVGPALEQALASPPPAGAVDVLLERTREAADDVRTSLQQGRNRLLELNSCHPRRASEFVSSVADAARNLELDTYMERVFDRFGVDHQTHTADSIVLHPTDHMIAHSFPGLPEDGITATFSRIRALAREDMQFLTWEHPMVTGVMDLIVNGELGNTALGTIKVPGLNPGTLILETLHLLHCVAPASFAVERYSPQPLLRVVIDDAGRNLTEALPPETINAMIQRVPGRTAEELVRRARAEIGALVAQAVEAADAVRAELVTVSLQTMSMIRAAEQERLETLARVNSNLRATELDYHRETTEKLHAYLQTADLKLDALRVIIAV
jgi:ATP-dependent helicase HepA